MNWFVYEIRPFSDKSVARVGTSQVIICLSVFDFSISAHTTIPNLSHKTRTFTYASTDSLNKYDARSKTYKQRRESSTHSYQQQKRLIFTTKPNEIHHKYRAQPNNVYKTRRCGLCLKKTSHAWAWRRAATLARPIACTLEMKRKPNEQPTKRQQNDIPMRHIGMYTRASTLFKNAPSEHKNAHAADANDAASNVHQTAAASTEEQPSRVVSRRKRHFDGQIECRT